MTENPTSSHESSAQRTILEEIVESVQAALEDEVRRVPEIEVRRWAETTPPPRDFKGALTGGPEDIRIIAEAKRASPSAGLIAKSYDPVGLTLQYESGGATALSVLTEPRYFQGHLNHLSAVSKSVSIPVLRKDFTVAPYQIYQARAAGADAVLLITRCLRDEEIRDFQGLAQDLGMAALVETHTAEEIERAVACGADLIGVNNRNLTNFHTNTETSLELATEIPGGCVKVAESGIHSRADIEPLQKSGFHCFLVGEALMRASDPAKKLRELRGVSG